MNCNREIGEIVMFAGATSPMFYLPCDGRSVPKDLYANLYSIIGDDYTPSTSVTHFNIPNFTDRFARMSQVGVPVGEATVSLTESQLPTHTHDLMASNAPGNSNSPAGAILGNAGAFDFEYINTTPTVSMHPGAISAVGDGTGHNNIPPFLGVNFIIYTGV